MTADSKRELGTIVSASSGAEDHGLYGCWVQVDFGGGGQAFGGIIPNENLKSYIQELCATFDVTSLDQLKGKKCYALRCWSTWNERIEGLESWDTDRIFTLTGWSKRMGFISFDSSQLEERRRHLQDRLSSIRRQARELEHEIEHLGDDYTEWW